MKTSLSKTVYVVWPPVWNAFDPHVAVPALCGYLIGQGVPVRQFDLNINFFRYLVAEETIETQIRESTRPQPRKILSAIDFARQYYRVLRTPLAPGYQQRFSEDAEKLLLANALALFNHHHPETTFSTLGVYHTGDIDDSDFVSEFAAQDASNPFATFFRRAFLPEVEKDLPGVVGISVCGSFQLGAAFTLARLIKEVEPRICVVMGGAFFSSMPEVLVKPKTAGNLFRYVDAFIFNEGEIPFLRLINDVSAGGRPQPGPNVHLPSQRELADEPSCCLSPDHIATPDFADGAMKKYFRPVPRIPVEVSRGCYWGKCRFCNLSAGANNRYRSIAIDNIMQSLSTLTLRYRASSVLFSTLAMAPSILRGVSQRLLDEHMQISWSAWIRPEKTLTEKDIDTFRRSGCSSLAVTPESFNSNTLSRMAKGFNLEHVIRIVRHLRQAGLCEGINIIAGFPGETLEDFLGTVEVCRELGLRGEFFPFCLLKNSPIYRAAEQFGLVMREQSEKDLAVALPFVYARDPAAPSGIDMIKTASKRYPGYLFAEDPFAGYTFDFSSLPPQAAQRSA